MYDYPLSSMLHTLHATLLPHVTSLETNSRKEWHHLHDFLSSVYTSGFLYAYIWLLQTPPRLERSSSVFLSVPSPGSFVTIGTHQPGEGLGKGLFEMLLV